MRPPVLRASFEGELVVDSFAGGGGASTGIEAALGRPVDIAINHSPQAIAMHLANHLRSVSAWLDLLPAVVTVPVTATACAGATRRSPGLGDASKPWLASGKSLSCLPSSTLRRTSWKNRAR